MAELIATGVIKQLLLPPGIFIVVLLIGLLLWSWRKTAFILVLLSVGGLYATSMPWVAHWLMHRLEKPYYDQAVTARTLDKSRADSIVILGGGRQRNALEYEGDTASTHSLERLRFGAWLARRTQLPVYITGGARYDNGAPEAEIHAKILQEEFFIANVNMENSSRTTYENAVKLANLFHELKKSNRIFLVTHAYHLPRAEEAFQKVGFEVVPVPIAFHVAGEGESVIFDFLPSANALRDSHLALHEHVGRWWYKLRYYE